MASLHLGTIGNQTRTYEIHAFTNGLPFREFKASQIGDNTLYRTMLNERYTFLESGKPAYFTLMNVDKEKREVANPHDDRTGTIHLAALDKETGNMAYLVSVAVDTGERDGGDIIGLPLENRWRSGGSQEGANLDPFRERYLRLNYASVSHVKPWQMAELYRHFKTVTDGGDLTARIGLYTGLYHLLVREARRKDRQATHIWVFYAVPKHFHLYRLAGGAVLRDPIVENPPRHISPNIDDIQYASVDGKKCVIYNHEVISRNFKVPIPCPGVDYQQWELEDVAFLDGLIDIQKVEEAVQTDPVEISPIRYQGMTQQDIDKLRIALSVLGKRYYEDCHPDNLTITSTNIRLRGYLATCWEFGEIGI